MGIQPAWGRPGAFDNFLQGNFKTRSNIGEQQWPRYLGGGFFNINGEILHWDWIDFSSHSNNQDLLGNLKGTMTQWETNSKQCEEQRRNQPQRRY
eukprot:12271204-Heterocapsa_arctica.AAC.1